MWLQLEFRFKKENGLINGANHVISSMNRVKKIQLLIVYQCILLKSILFNFSMLDKYEIKLVLLYNNY